MTSDRSQHIDRASSLYVHSFQRAGQVPPPVADFILMIGGGIGSPIHMAPRPPQGWAAFMQELGGNGPLHASWYDETRR